VKSGAGYTSYYYHADGLGSITGLSDATGTMVQTYGYDAFGNVTVSGSGNVAQPFMFTGREYDAETSMYFYRARYYDPVVGRFVTKDPIGFAGGDVNLYNYVDGNAVNDTDPEGLGTAVPIPAPMPLPPIFVPQTRLTPQQWQNMKEDISNLFDSVQRKVCDKNCPPCSPYPVGTIGYIGPHNDHSHYPFGRGHLNTFTVNQRKSDCKCYWNNSGPAWPPPSPGWINLNGGFPVLSP